ncbi:neurotensin receptor type 2 isoform X2 [Papio anubis]|uniref:neurotensin receptor type 2 isoform X2 n=1 Tax=Papio anubis TaxID=9555 RepID=UPI0004F224B8|nr:neurotensin receptor type 2 isoform X2 [Papio anubis]
METSSPPPPRSSPNLGLSLDARLGVDTRLWAKVLFTALYALIWALGAAGNALSVHVVLKARAGRAGRLRYHVLSLALSGLLLLVVGVPVELYSFVWFHYPWVFGDLGCRGYYFVRELCAYATVLSVTGLSAERCVAVCQPLRARSLLTPRRTRRLVALLWAASLGLALPMALIMGQKHELETAGGEPEPASRVCTVLVSRTALQVFIQVNVLVSFVLPLALTAFLNGVMVSHLLALCSQVPSTSALGSSTPSRLELLSEEGLLSFIVWKKTFIQGGQVSLEPSWPCMSSAGCRTMPAGSCTATSLMTHGLKCEEDTKLRPHELTKVSSAETKTCTPFMTRLEKMREFIVCLSEIAVPQS